MDKDSFIILSDKSDPSVNIVGKAARKAEKKNKKLFGINPKPYKIKLVYSDAEYDKATGVYERKTIRNGYVKGNTIILISPKVHKLAYDTESFFFHEINHIFYKTLVGNYNPVWLSEGIATYLMGSYKVDENGWKKHFRGISNPDKYLYYRYIKKRYYANADKFYVLSYLIFKEMYKMFGWKKILRFLQEFAKKPLKQNFDNLFEKRFSIKLNVFVKEALKPTG